MGGSVPAEDRVRLAWSSGPCWGDRPAEEPHLRVARDPKADRAHRAAVASDPDTPVDLLDLMARTQPDMATRLAGNPSVPLGTLRVILRRRAHTAYLNLAGHPNADEGMLRWLSTRDWHVAVAVCGNPNAGPGLLEQIYGRMLEDAAQHGLPHPQAYRLVAVASSPRAPVEVLRQISTVCDEDVDEAVAGNPSTPGDVLVELALRYAPGAVSRAAANNPNCPEHIRAILTLGDADI